MGNILHRFFQLLLLIAQLNQLNGSGNGGELWVKGDGWVLGAVGRCWVSGAGGCCGWAGGRGALRGVKYFGHLVVVEAVEVVADSSMGVFVLEGLVLVFVALSVLVASRQWSRWSKGVVIEVPGRGSKLVPGRRVVEQVGGVGSVGGSQVGSWSFFHHVLPLFMLSRGWRL